MTTLEKRNIMLEKGRPRVAVPITAESPADIIAACEVIRDLPCDMVEWRADHYLSAIEGLDQWLQEKDAYVDIVKILDDMEYIVEGKPIIFTIRSSAQGGEVQVTRDQLESIYDIVARSGLADFVDIELYDREDRLRDGWIEAQIEKIHAIGGRVILSHHDLEGMPEPEAITDTVKIMHGLGADICKYAAMAHSREEAEAMMKASAYLDQQRIGPLVMLAMGEEGIATRVAGGKYGSVITFAAATPEEASAPGQPDVHTMKKWLDEQYGEASEENTDGKENQ